VIKSRVREVAHMEEKRNACGILVRKPEGQKEKCFI
jgi:hypothetical protein